MAFFTTLTLSSFSSRFRLAMSRSRSSLSRLLNGSETTGSEVLEGNQNQTRQSSGSSPGFLNEPDHKLPDFHGPVRLEGDDLLSNRNISNQIKTLKYDESANQADQNKL